MNTHDILPFFKAFSMAEMLCANAGKMSHGAHSFCVRWLLKSTSLALGWPIAAVAGGYTVFKNLKRSKR